VKSNESIAKTVTNIESVVPVLMGATPTNVIVEDTTLQNEGLVSESLLLPSQGTPLSEVQPVPGNLSIAAGVDGVSTLSTITDNIADNFSNPEDLKKMYSERHRLAFNQQAFFTSKTDNKNNPTMAVNKSCKPKAELDHIMVVVQHWAAFDAGEKADTLDDNQKKQFLNFKQKKQIRIQVVPLLLCRGNGAA
jgi:hypothetical protein